ncbi:ABC transporter substrate-binding protein [Phaeacidiphilus oryzae]|uniref:ABC transporter substrate-binding protein n=1 Tax=Phaeacidiphilus oryzae TaxID=348818 RepID=UPI0005643381|nr:extracellular solute-binding protein [Phaeacidiphilus oryzae]
MHIARKLRRSPRRAAGALAGVLLLAGLSACAGAASATGVDARPQPARSPAQLLPEARKEGSVVWYTTFADDDVNHMIAAFQKTYPGIRVKALRLSADQLPTRLVTEQRGGKYTADVISADCEPVYQLIKVGTLAPYAAPQQMALPPQLRDLPDGYRNVVYVLTSTIAYNPEAVRKAGLQPPTSLQDLTKPQWRGRFSIDPSAINWYESLISSMGHAAALHLVEELGNNDPQLVESHTQSLTQVQSGEPAASVNAYGYKASALSKKTPTRMAFSNTDPLPSAAALAELANRAPHQAAAELFLDWIMSPAGQRIVVQVTNHTVLGETAADDKSVWNPAKWKPAWSLPVITADTYNRYLTEYQKALHDG